MDFEQICTDFYKPKAGARRIPALFNSRIYPDIAKTIIRSSDARGAMKINYDATTKKFLVDPPKIIVANENDMAREVATVAAAQGFNAATGPR